MQKIDIINGKSEDIINNILSFGELTEEEKDEKFISTTEIIDNLMLEVDIVHDMFMIMKDFQMVVDENKKENYMDCEDLVNQCKDVLIETLKPEDLQLEISKIQSENLENVNDENENPENDKPDN